MILELAEITSRRRDGARELTVLERVSLEVFAGELIGLYGERRAGKSTLMRIAAGLQAPDEGTVAFDGRRLAAMSTNGRSRLWRRGGIALADCDVKPFEGGQPVLEHVALPLTAQGLTLGECEGLARPVLERVGLAPISHEPVSRLSLTDRVRVQAARAIVREPRVLLVDEPAVMPGPADTRELLSAIRSLTSDGVAVIIASEDMSLLSGVDRFLTLTDGRLRSTDSRKRVIELPDRRERRVG